MKNLAETFFWFSVCSLIVIIAAGIAEGLKAYEEPVWHVECKSAGDVVYSGDATDLFFERGRYKFIDVNTGKRISTNASCVAIH